MHVHPGYSGTLTGRAVRIEQSQAERPQTERLRTTLLGGGRTMASTSVADWAGAAVSAPRPPRTPDRSISGGFRGDRRAAAMAAAAYGYGYKRGAGLAVPRPVMPLGQVPWPHAPHSLHSGTPRRDSTAFEEMATKSTKGLFPADNGLRSAWSVAFHS